MPIAARRPCRRMGCRELTANGGYCDKCQAKGFKREKYRPSSSERGYGYKWQKYRASVLARNPICVDPFGEHAERNEIARATRLDHRIPHRGDQKLFWDKSNHQPLCERCHNRKTATFDGGFGRDSSQFF
jgi:5-methylcytosine-specific restriction protein A